MLKITQSAISQKSLNLKKRYFKFTYLYTFVQILGSKFKIPIATEISELFWHLGDQHLTAQQKVQWWHTQKSKIG